MKTHDTLQCNAQNFYAVAWGSIETKERREHRLRLDEAGRELYAAAARAEYMRRAKGSGNLRRIYSNTYLSRSECGEKIYLNDFLDIGVRGYKVLDKGWYTDDMYSETMNGVVVLIGRHNGTADTWEDCEGLFMAGTQHSDLDGVTLYTETYSTYEDAERAADHYAQHEAKKCIEEDEEYYREQRAEEIKSGIVVLRRKCLALLRDMRPVRKGLLRAPESVCIALNEAVQGYLSEIRGYRNELKELA